MHWKMFWQCHLKTVRGLDSMGLIPILPITSNILNNPWANDVGGFLDGQLT